MKIAHLGLIAVAALSCKSKTPDSGSEPAPPSEEGAKFACPDRSLVVDFGDSSGALQTHLEIGCESTPYFRGTMTKAGTAQPVAVTISVADLEDVWKAVDAAAWKKLPEACGGAPDPADKMTVELRIHAADTDRTFRCAGPILPGHAKIIDAIKLVAPDRAFAGLAIAEPAQAKPADSISGDCATI